MIKSVIMAGGEGSRLRPLTCDIPKPMARLCGRPIIEYILDLLHRHGVKEAAITMRYLPDRITEHFPSSRYKDIDLLFVEEHEPLGTAGSVRNSCGSDDENILVISGDALCDFNLTKAIEKHLHEKADVTIIGKRVADPREYGLILQDKSGRIGAFLEKPAYSQAISDMANTGIYILSRRALDMIPPQRQFDFAQDLFPAMLAADMKLICHEDNGYWCDIGNLETYMSCQHDMLSGKVDCDIHANESEDGNFYKTKRPIGSYIISGPVYIGEDVKIGRGVTIEAGSVIDDGSVIGDGCRISGSVILRNCIINSDVRLTSALVGDSAVIKSGAMMFEESALGPRAVVGENAVISAGVRVWNGKRIPPSMTVVENVKLGGEKRGFFGEDGISGQVGVEMTPEFCARVGAAIGTLYPNGKIGLGYGAEPSSLLLADALASGIRSTGCWVVDFGETFLTQFEFSVNYSALRLGIHISREDITLLQIVGEGGLPATRSDERNIEMLLSRGEFRRSLWDSIGDKVSAAEISELYPARLLRFAPTGLSGLSVTVKSSNPLIQKAMSRILKGLCCDHGDDITAEISAAGTKVDITSAAGEIIPYHKIISLCGDYFMGQGEDIAVPFDAPLLLDDLAQKYGKKVFRYYNCPADNSDARARHLAARQMWSRDALIQSIAFLNIVKIAGGLSQALSSLPDCEREQRTVDLKTNPASILRRFSGSDMTAGVTEGVRIKRGQGTLLLRPLKSGTAIRILAEAASGETARELCDFAENLMNSTDI